MAAVTSQVEATAEVEAIKAVEVRPQSNPIHIQSVVVGPRPKSYSRPIV